MEELIQVGTVVATRGNRGEVAVRCPSRHPERLTDLASVLVEFPGGEPVRRKLVRNWVHRGRLILHFEGVAAIGDAEKLVGSRIYVLESELPELGEGTFYVYRLLGARVMSPTGREYGRVVDAEEGPGQDQLVVERPDGSRALVPMTSAIVRSIDISAGRILVDAPEGLLVGEAEIAGGKE
ncbi:MAG: ribosome maturation factor RimM [Acidobacteriota bacterium]